MSIATTNETNLRTLEIGSQRSKAPKFKELDDIFSYYTNLGEFCIGGEADLTEDVSKLFYKSSDGVIKIVDFRNISEKDMDMLADNCSVSPFGMGGKSVVDPNVRQAKELKAADFSFQFTPQMNSSIFSQIKQLLGGREFTMEPYKLNIYPEGGHFKRHKDTLKNDKMIASLVVCLPMAFEGGILTVENEKGLSVNFDWGKEISESETEKIRWACFFCSCDHLISTVTKGNRITIAYDIFRNDTKQNIADNKAMSITEIYQIGCNENLHDLIRKLDVTKEYGYFPNHKYSFEDTNHGVDVRDQLKGNDVILYDILKVHGWEVTLLVYYPDLKSYGPSTVTINNYVEKGEDISDWIYGENLDKLKKLSTLTLLNMEYNCIKQEIKMYLADANNYLIKCKRRRFCGGIIMILRHERTSAEVPSSSSTGILRYEHLNTATTKKTSKSQKFETVNKIFSYYTSLGKFCIGGEVELPPNASKLFYQSSNSSMELIDFLNISEKDIDTFRNNCSPVDMGGKSVVDPNVGIAKELKPTAFSFQFISHMKSSVTSQIKQLLGGREFTLKLGTLNIYPKGGHFKSRKDALKQENLFASLVICLPVAFKGGILTVKKKKGRSVDLDWGKQISDTKQIKWVCFCYGCDNFISTVTKGNRITIVYDIFLDDSKKDISNTKSITGMYLADCSKHLHYFIHKLDVTVEYGYFPNHVYSLGDTNGTEEEVRDKLKGNDLMLFDILKVYGWKVILLVYCPDISTCGPLSSVRVSYYVTEDDCDYESDGVTEASNVWIKESKNRKMIAKLKLLNKEDPSKRLEITKFSTTGNEPVYQWKSVYGSTIMVLRHQSNSRITKKTKK